MTSEHKNCVCPKVDMDGAPFPGFCDGCLPNPCKNCGGSGEVRPLVGSTLKVECDACFGSGDADYDPAHGDCPFFDHGGDEYDPGTCDCPDDE